MNKSIRFPILVLLFLLAIPQVTFASWWNPLTWGIFQGPPKAQIQSVQVGTTSVGVLISSPVIKTTATSTLAKTLPKKVSPPNQNIQISRSPTSNICEASWWTQCSNGKYFVCPTTGNPYCQTTPPPQQIITTTTPKSETQQTAQTTLPVPTAAEVSAVSYLCSIPAESQYCNSVFLNGYATNAVFRSDIDAIAQPLFLQHQQQVSKADQQANCMKTLAQPYDPSISPQANLYNSQTIAAACGIGTAPSQTAYQLQQLQDSVNANTAALQEQQRQQQANELYQQTQQILQQGQQPTQTTKPVHCEIDGGLLSCSVSN